MAREIMICQKFLTEEHKAKIQAVCDEFGFTPYLYDFHQTEEAKKRAATAEVIYGASADMLEAASADLRWFCCSSAGADAYCKESLYKNPDTILTNSAGAYGLTLAEHCVLFTLMLYRHMMDYQKGMDKKIWTKPIPVRSVRGSTITLLGTGDIGSMAAGYFKGMGAKKIIGICRSGKADPELFDEVYRVDQLEELLPTTTTLVMSLPGTPETYHILDEKRLRMLPSDAYVINVGRGTAIDTKALAKILNEGVIAGAALDVMEQEPLPEDDVLWDAKNLLMTPHVAGNYSLESTCDKLVDLFLTDLRHYAKGEPMEHVVDRKAGY